MQTEQEFSTALPNQHTFGAQSTAWLEGLAQRKRRPVAQSTLDTFSSRVRRLLPIVGPDTKLADIHNGFLRDLSSKLTGAPKTVNELLAVVKAVVASAVDPDTGDPLYPRTWNHSFIDAPTIGAQKQPCATADEVNRAIKNATNHQEQLLYAVLSGAGLRIAEALSIHVGGNKDQTSWDQVSATITIRSSIYNGAEQHRVKTQAAKRVADLDPRLNAAIIKFVAEQNIQPSAFLFQSSSGRAMHLRTATARLKKHGIQGFHTFRRFWTTRRREIGCPEDIIRFWLGHAGEGITDRYSKLAENVELRRSWASRCGLGFDLPTGDPTSAKSPKRAKKSRGRSLPEAAIEADVTVLANAGSPLPEPISKASEAAPAEPVFQASDSDLDPMFFQEPAPVPTQEELDAELTRVEELREILNGVE